MLEKAYVIKAGYLMVYTGIPCFLKVRFTSLSQKTDISTCSC